MTETLTQIVRDHPFFSGFDPIYFDLMLSCASPVSFNAGQQIFRENGNADRFFLIHGGRVALQTAAPGRGVITIQTIGADEVLGWSWLFPPYRWHFSARTLEATDGVAFDAQVLRQTAWENRDFGYEIAMRVGQVMLGRLQATRLQILDLYARP